MTDLLEHCGLDGKQRRNVGAVVISWFVHQQEINRFQIFVIDAVSKLRFFSSFPDCCVEDMCGTARLSSAWLCSVFVNASFSVSEPVIDEHINKSHESVSQSVVK